MTHICCVDILVATTEQAGRPDAEFIGRDPGFELCQKDGVEVIVLGSITKAGNTLPPRPAL